ncbi:MAG: hypothetical protein QME13_00375 [Thermoanaerobacteraceae bacterium]|nr:hypothetical protein [Thermoanaerobacteraceae bacterium]
MVAVGSLAKIWLGLPEDITVPEELQRAFEDYFGAEWNQVLVGAEKPFGYHAANNAYFAVEGLWPVENLTLTELLEREKVKLSANIIIS